MTPPPLARELTPRAITDVIARVSSLDALRVDKSDVAPPRKTPILYVDFTPERLAHTIRMIERSEAGGLVQHLFALRMLLPENALDAAPQLGETFATATRVLRAPLERFFVRLKMPRLTITQKDLEDRESRDALRTLVDALGDAPNAMGAGPARDGVRISGSVDVETVRALGGELGSAPLGAAASWLINAHLLGSMVEHDGVSSASLGSYRTELQNVFTVLSELPINEFHRVLVSTVNRTLDESLADVLDAMRGAAHLAVE
jgi:hypothetical protein